MSKENQTTCLSNELRINIGEAHELHYWSRRFKVTGAQLKKAVSEVGVHAADVETYLQKHSVTTS